MQPDDDYDARSEARYEDTSADAQSEQAVWWRWVGWDADTESTDVP